MPRRGLTFLSGAQQAPVQPQESIAVQAADAGPQHLSLSPALRARLDWSALVCRHSPPPSTDGAVAPPAAAILAPSLTATNNPDVATRINTMAIPPQREFWIVKRKPAGRGQKTRWDIYLEDPTPLAGESPLERDLRLSLHEIERQKSIPEAESAPVPAQPPCAAVATPVCSPPTPGVQQVALTVVSRKQPAWAQTLVGQTNQLVDAFSECMLHAAHHGLTIKPEDVRTLLVTAFINLSQRGRTTA